MDDNSAGFLKSIKDRDRAKLLRGIYTLLESKFPKENYNIRPIINDEGYHMVHLGVSYNIDFFYDERLLHPKSSGINFKLKAELPEINGNLEDRLNQRIISNRELDETRYLSQQVINLDAKTVNISCRIKKIPGLNSDINNLYSQLWGNIIKRVFSGIHNLR